jgi:hypothetical protein
MAAEEHDRFDIFIHRVCPEHADEILGRVLEEAEESFNERLVSVEAERDNWRDAYRASQAAYQSYVHRLEEQTELTAVRERIAELEEFVDDIATVDTPGQLLTGAILARAGELMEKHRGQPPGQPHRTP